MICFFCATPYHMFLSLLLKKGKFLNESADLVLYNHFKDSLSVKEKIQKTHEFKNVYFLDENNYSKTGKLKRCIHVFFPNKVVRTIAKKAAYDEMIFFALDFQNIAYLIKSYSHKKKCQFSFGEDGIGSYINPYIYTPNKPNRFFLRLTNRAKYLSEINTIYLLSPDLVNISLQQDLRKIHYPFTYAAQINELCVSIWGDTNIYDGFKVIYLDEPYAQDHGYLTASREEAVLEMLKTFFEKDLIIKLHPRTRFYPYTDVALSKTSAPFECLFQKGKISNKIVFSIMSTAASSIGLLYGESPYLIFTYKLFPNIPFPFLETINGYLLKLKTFPIYQNKIFVPDSLDDLYSILKSINSKTV